MFGLCNKLTCVTSMLSALETSLHSIFYALMFKVIVFVFLVTVNTICKSIAKAFPSNKKTHDHYQSCLQQCAHRMAQKKMTRLHSANPSKMPLPFWAGPQCWSVRWTTWAEITRWHGSRWIRQTWNQPCLLLALKHCSGRTNIVYRRTAIDSGFFT